MEHIRKISCIACSIFRNEIEALLRHSKLDIDMHYLPSLLHMKPAVLKQRLDSQISKEMKKGKNVLLLFGDCHAGMYEHENMPGVVRTAGINCPEILLGKDKYRALRKSGAFFLLPEWTVKWRKIFQHELGLNEKNAKDFMSEFHSNLIYLDMGVIPVQEEEMKSISEFTGLPWEVVKVTSESLLETIMESLKKLKNHD